ncbi:MAG: glycosyltransferase family 4 protein [Myxococcales bacterium]|nr:glycosyltransferase family 4 protein [Myxococcales bacterium]
MQGHVLAFEEAAGFGGAFIDLRHIALELVKRGVRVTVARSWDGPGWEPLRDAGVTLLKHPKSMVSDRLYERGDVPRHVRKVVFAAEVGLTAGTVGGYYAAWGKRHGVTHIFNNNGIIHNVAGVAAAKMLGVPLLCYVQGIADGTSGFRRIVGLADTVFCVSKTTEDSVLAQGADPSRTRLLYPGVDLPSAADAAPRPADGRVRVGMVGMFMPWKGQIAFLDAFAPVARAHPEVDGFLYGRLPSGAQRGYRDEIFAAIERLGLSSRVQVVEDRSEASRIFPEVDVSVHCSTQPEPFGRVVIEAMSYGRPVIAGPGGPSEVIDQGVNGFRIDPADVRGFTATLERLVSDGALRGRVAVAGREHVARHFTYPAVLGSLFDRLRETGVDLGPT